jgi:hypothetical protein
VAKSTKFAMRCDGTQFKRNAKSCEAVQGGRALDGAQALALVTLLSIS